MRGSFLRAAAAMAVAASWPAIAAAPQAPTAAQLMALAFPGWSDAARLQPLTLPETAAHGVYAGWQAGANRALAEPMLVLRSDASHLTLVAGLVPAGADGRSAAAHLTPMALAAYQFEQHGGAWTLAARQGVFALRGFSGAAKVAAVALSNRHQGLAVEYGSCWQGYCGTWMTLYEVEQDKVRREPLVELALSGINVNSALDCGRRLQPLIKPPPQDTALHEDAEGAPPGSHDCYAIESSWSIGYTHGHTHGQPGDLAIHYHGAISRAEAHAAAPVAVDQRQVLRYDSGRYRAVSGFNPVPPI